MKLYTPVFIDNDHYEVMVWDQTKNDNVLVKFGNSESPEITKLLKNGDTDMLNARAQFLSSGNPTMNQTSPDYWIERYIWLSGDPYNFVTSDNTAVSNPIFPAIPVSSMSYFTPVFVDGKYYQVLVKNPNTGSDVLITFGDSESPNITKRILEKDSETMLQRSQYLSQNMRIDDPTLAGYWIARYIWRSGDPYVYIPVDDQKYSEPSYPAPNAVDPPYVYPYVIPGSYSYGYPYYGSYYDPYYPYYSTYPAYGYGGYGGYGGGAVVAGALTGLAVGSLLGSSYGGYGNYNERWNHPGHINTSGGGYRGGGGGYRGGGRH